MKRFLLLLSFVSYTAIAHGQKDTALRPKLKLSVIIGSTPSGEVSKQWLKENHCLSVVIDTVYVPEKAVYVKQKMYVYSKKLKRDKRKFNLSRKDIIVEKNYMDSAFRKEYDDLYEPSEYYNLLNAEVTNFEVAIIGFERSCFCSGSCFDQCLNGIMTTRDHQKIYFENISISIKGERLSWGPFSSVVYTIDHPAIDTSLHPMLKLSVNIGGKDPGGYIAKEFLIENPCLNVRIDTVYVPDKKKYVEEKMSEYSIALKARNTKLTKGIKKEKQAYFEKEYDDLFPVSMYDSIKNVKVTSFEFSALDCENRVVINENCISENNKYALQCLKSLKSSQKIFFEHIILSNDGKVLNWGPNNLIFRIADPAAKTD